MNIQVQEVAYHRNGVAGEGFHVVRFTLTEGGMPHPNLVGAVVGGVVHPHMVGIVFDSAAGRVAVLDADMVVVGGNIAFARGNSWRGDQFEGTLRDSIKAYEDGRRGVTPLDTAIEDHDKVLDKAVAV